MTMNIVAIETATETVGVAGVPGSSFFDPKGQGRSLVRFMFAKRVETLREAGGRLRRMRSVG